jgi:hypothetical protein
MLKYLQKPEKKPNIIDTVKFNKFQKFVKIFIRHGFQQHNYERIKPCHLTGILFLVE